MDKEFLRIVKDIKSLRQEPSTFMNRWHLRKLNKRLKKLIKNYAKKQADIAYNQTLNLYNIFLENNL